MSNKTNYAILGILTLGPQSGYDIKKLISESTGYFWQESYGQLYPALKKMVELGWIQLRKDKKKGRPEKKIYNITEQGRERLKEWLEEPIITMPKLRHELLLKLFFGIEINPRINILHVSNYREKCCDYLEELKTVNTYIRTNQKENPSSTFWLITVSYGLQLLQAEINWCDETIQILSKREI